VAFDSPEAAQRIEREGEVLLPLTGRVVDRVQRATTGAGRAVGRVLDLGCGPGVGSCLLAERFPEAVVIAADSAPAMLDGARQRATRLGLADRVEVRQVDLPDGMAGLGRFDLVWASMVVHHIGDEADVIRRIRDLVEPVGAFALVERAGPIRLLADDAELGRPGLWERLDAAWEAWFGQMRAELPGATESRGYPAMLRAAGFTVEVDEEVAVEQEPPLDDAARAFVHEQFARAQQQLADHADPADLEALQPAVDAGGFRARRQLLVGRAPIR
jgi:SAM-dependent methyltransferase